MIIDEKHYDNITCMHCRFRHPPHLSCASAGLLAAARASSDGSHIEPPAEANSPSYVPLPEGSGALLSATVFSGKLLIACENGVYVRTGSGTWEKILV